MHHLAKFINLAAASPPLGEILLEESQMILIFKRLFAFFPIICKAPSLVLNRVGWWGYRSEKEDDSGVHPQKAELLFYAPVIMIIEDHTAGEKNLYQLATERSSAISI